MAVCLSTDGRSTGERVEVVVNVAVVPVVCRADLRAPKCRGDDSFDLPSGLHSTGRQDVAFEHHFLTAMLNMHHVFLPVKEMRAGRAPQNPQIRTHLTTRRRSCRCAILFRLRARPIVGWAAQPVRHVRRGSPDPAAAPTAGLPWLRRPAVGPMWLGPPLFAAVPATGHNHRFDRRGSPDPAADATAGLHPSVAVATYTKCREINVDGHFPKP
jgi:hypothetical protein